MNIKTTCAACAALLLGAAAPQGAGGEMAYEKYTSDGAYFSVMAPAVWQKHEAISEGRQNREFGLTLKGPKNTAGAYLRVSVIFYAPDHPRFKTAEKFIKRNAFEDPTMKIKGETYGPLKPIILAGLRGQQFERKTFDFIPPYGVNPKKVPVIQYRVVLPGKKGGFYVLTYHAPQDISAQSLPVFKKITDTFRPGE